jgi:hypothetical protein
MLKGCEETQGTLSNGRFAHRFVEKALIPLV